jgi:hypothetical protein
MPRFGRALLLGLCLVTASYSTRQGKYWICNNAIHKSAKQERLESRCMPANQATAEAEEHRKIHPNDVVVFTCVM